MIQILLLSFVLSNRPLGWHNTAFHKSVSILYQKVYSKEITTGLMFTSHDEKVICLSLDDAPVNMDFSSALLLIKH